MVIEVDVAETASRDAAGWTTALAAASDLFVPVPGNAAVVPTPDRERGNLIKAFIVLTPGYSAGSALIAELQGFVRGKLAPYEYPQEIEFIDELPMTTTGKVQRRVLRLPEAEKKGNSRQFVAAAQGGACTLRLTPISQNLRIGAAQIA